MSWHTSMAPQRRMPRGEVAMSCAGRRGKERNRTG